MRLNRALHAAALLSVASLSLPAVGQDVPPPPPAGVTRTQRKVVPVKPGNPAPATAPAPAPAAAPPQSNEPTPAEKPSPAEKPAPAEKAAPADDPASLPQLPENPIRLEENKALTTPAPSQAEPPAAAPGMEQDVVVPNPAPEVFEPMDEPQGVPVAPAEGPAEDRPPVKVKGPVYYFPVDPFTFPANVTTPPRMHIPNSPDVHDLSVDGDHGRYTYYSYRRPWYTPGHRSANVTIVW